MTPETTATMPDLSVPAPPADEPGPWVVRLVAVCILGTAGLVLVGRLAVQVGFVLIVGIASLFASLALESGVHRLAVRGMPRRRAVRVVVAGLAGLVAIVMLAFVPAVLDETELVANQSRTYARVVAIQLRRAGIEVTTEDVRSAIIDNLDQVPLVAVGVSGLVRIALPALLGVIAFVVFTAGLVTSGPQLRRTICGFLPPARQHVVLHVWEMAIDRSGTYLLVRSLLAFAAGVVAAIGFRLIGLPHPYAFATWVTMVCFVVPVIGAYLAVIVPLVVGLAVSPWTALGVLVVVLGWKQVEDFWLDPSLTDRVLRVHPAVSFGVLIAGASVAGVAGMVAAVPVTAIVQGVISAYARRHELVQSPLVNDR